MRKNLEWSICGPDAKIVTLSASSGFLSKKRKIYADRQFRLSA